MLYTYTYPLAANLPMPYLNNVGYCDPLGDQNVWGTMFRLQESMSDEVIMLATKVHYVLYISQGRQVDMTCS